PHNRILWKRSQQKHTLCRLVRPPHRYPSMDIRRLLAHAAVVTIAAATVTPQALFGQLCAGSTRFASGPVRVGAGASFTDGLRGFGAEIAVGRSRGAFGSVSLASLDYDDIDEGALGVTLGAGFSVPVNATGSIELCPTVAFSSQSGPEIDTGFGVAELSGRTFGIGASIGGVIASSSTLEVLPSISGSFLMPKVTLTYQGASESESEEYFALGVAVGFVINRTFNIRPSIALPVGLENSDPVFGIGLGANFGSPSRQ
ncbi:MAG: hypothetical protein ACYC0B_11000, partial [Gemmatimonadaceae bacterium]